MPRRAHRNSKDHAFRPNLDGSIKNLNRSDHKKPAADTTPYALCMPGQHTLLRVHLRVVTIEGEVPPEPEESRGLAWETWSWGGGLVAVCCGRGEGRAENL